MTVRQLSKPGNEISRDESKKMLISDRLGQPFRPTNKQADLTPFHRRENNCVRIQFIQLQIFALFVFNYEL